jgi:hypothetical protein
LILNLFLRDAAKELMPKYFDADKLIDNEELYYIPGINKK